jgi:hypothetical protein
MSPWSGIRNRRNRFFIMGVGLTFRQDRLLSFLFAFALIFCLESSAVLARRESESNYRSKIDQ